MASRAKLFALRVVSLVVSLRGRCWLGRVVDSPASALFLKFEQREPCYPAVCSGLENSH